VILYGRNPVREVLRGRRRVFRTWAAADLDWLTGVEAERVDAERLEELCGSPEHQGVCAEAEPYPYADADSLLATEEALVVCLDQVQDPHNLGAVCRVAEATGVAGVVIPERRAVEVTPAVCKASAGAVEHLPIARVRNVADWLRDAKDAGAWVYGAAAGARVPYDEPDWSGRAVLVLGSEGQGIRPRVAATCDELIALPMDGQVESLNVSTAAAALLYGVRLLRAGRDLASRPGP
jgi:23S rRNA (guanosine2251-2'-O)-methyltransferase